MQNNPGYVCKGCKDRTVEPNCHMTCQKFLEQKDKYEEYKARIREIKDKEIAVREYKKERVLSTMRKMGKKI